MTAATTSDLPPGHLRTADLLGALSLAADLAVGLPAEHAVRSFVENGGQIWVCGACTKPRGIAEGDLIDGAKIVTAANVVEYLASGAATLSF